MNTTTEPLVAGDPATLQELDFDELLQGIEPVVTRTERDTGWQFTVYSGAPEQGTVVAFTDAQGEEVLIQQARRMLEEGIGTLRIINARRDAVRQVRKDGVRALWQAMVQDDSVTVDATWTYAERLYNAGIRAPGTSS